MNPTPYNKDTIYGTLAECYLDACAHDVLKHIEQEDFYRKNPEKEVYTEGGWYKEIFIRNFMWQALKDGRVKEYPDFEAHLRSIDQ